MLSVAFVLLPLFMMAQTEGGGTNNSGGAETKGVDARIERQKAKRDWKKNRKQEMSDAKAKKEYNKKNTKKTRKRMKKNEKKAKKNNEHRRDFFLVRWWRKITH
jgi:hypothetical protein